MAKKTLKMTQKNTYAKLDRVRSKRTSYLNTTTPKIMNTIRKFYAQKNRCDRNYTHLT